MGPRVRHQAHRERAEFPAGELSTTGSGGMSRKTGQRTGVMNTTGQHRTGLGLNYTRVLLSTQTIG